MRILRFLIGLLFAVAGIAIGALNPQSIVIDFGFAMVPVTVGVSILMALLLGVVLGGLMLSISVVWPLRQQLRRGRTESKRIVATPIDAFKKSGL